VLEGNGEFQLHFLVFDHGGEGFERGCRLLGRGSKARARGGDAKAKGLRFSGERHDSGEEQADIKSGI
jgi:hypothetical protein